MNRCPTCHQIESRCGCPNPEDLIESLREDLKTAIALANERGDKLKTISQLTSFLQDQVELVKNQIAAKDAEITRLTNELAKEMEAGNDSFEGRISALEKLVNGSARNTQLETVVTLCGKALSHPMPHPNLHPEWFSDIKAAKHAISELHP